MNPNDEKRMREAEARVAPLIEARRARELARGQMPPLKFKRLHGAAVAPRRATDGSVGYDLVAVEDYVITAIPLRLRTGIAIELPPGYEGQIRPRSSMSYYGIHVPIGTIDQDYTGELLVVMSLNGGRGGRHCVAAGDRIAQLVISPVWTGDVVQVEELGETARGAGGFGSTGRSTTCQR